MDTEWTNIIPSSREPPGQSFHKRYNHQNMIIVGRPNDIFFVVIVSTSSSIIQRHKSDSSGYMHKNLSFVEISKCTLNKNKIREISNKISFYLKSLDKIFMIWLPVNQH